MASSVTTASGTRLAKTDTILTDSIVETRAQLAQGLTSATQVAERCLQRIAERDGDIKAWSHLDVDQARLQACRADGQPIMGALHGIPVGIKDIFDTADMPTEYGSPIYRGHRPAQDAMVVRRLRDAGSVIVGKTVTTEFAHSFPGPTCNPHNLAHTPGGSSSGSAAAVAAGFVLAAVGTQTSGSVIRPASYCGVVGFKPTYDRIPTAGVKALAPSLDTVGVFARSVQDAGIVARTLWGSITKEHHTERRPRRVGYCQTPYWSQRESGVEDALQSTVTTLRQADIAVDQFELPAACGDLNAAQEVIFAYEANREYVDLARLNPTKISPDLRILLDAGDRIPERIYQSALQQADIARAAYAEAIAGFDFLLTPSAVGEAPHGLRLTGNPLFNRLWTLLHVPCLSLPAFTGPQQLPIGIQLAGAANEDETLLSFGQWLWSRIHNNAPMHTIP